MTIFSEITADYMLTDINECRIGNHTCEQKCVNTNGSYYCDCLNGYKVRRDKRTCKGNNNDHLLWELLLTHIDINECSSDTHGCEQNCVNTDGSYHCECQSGYELRQRDKRTCKGKLVLVKCAKVIPITCRY